MVSLNIYIINLKKILTVLWAGHLNQEQIGHLDSIFKKAKKHINCTVHTRFMTNELLDQMDRHLFNKCLIRITDLTTA